MLYLHNMGFSTHPPQISESYIHVINEFNACVNDLYGGIILPPYMRDK